jgi:hypothetical protein
VADFGEAFLDFLINSRDKSRPINQLQKWHDFQMRWNPVDYGEITQIRVAPDKVWLPDIVLFNK